MALPTHKNWKKKFISTKILSSKTNKSVKTIYTCVENVSTLFYMKSFLYFYFLQILIHTYNICFEIYSLCQYQYSHSIYKCLLEYTYILSIDRMAKKRNKMKKNLRLSHKIYKDTYEQMYMCCNMVKYISLKLKIGFLFKSYD